MQRRSSGLVTVYERCLDWLRAPARRRPLGFGGSRSTGSPFAGGSAGFNSAGYNPLVESGPQAGEAGEASVFGSGSATTTSAGSGSSTTTLATNRNAGDLKTGDGGSSVFDDTSNSPDTAVGGELVQPFRSQLADAPRALAKPWSFNQTVLLSPRRRGSSVLMWTAVGTVAAVGIWAVTAPLAETIAVQGKLEPGNSTKRIDAPVPGVVEAVLVQEGQQVRKGDPLVRFDLREPRSNLAAAESIRERLLNENRIAAATLGDATATASLTPNQRQQLASQAEELASRREAARQELAKAEARLAGLGATLATYRNIANRFARLVGQGAASELQLLDARQKVQETESAIAEEQREIARLESTLINTGAVTNVELRRKVEENLRKISELDREIRLARQQIQYGQLTAPTDGTVFDIEVSTGSVVAQGTGTSASTGTKPLLKVVPQDALQARVYLPNKAVGFVRPGLKADLSIDAFNASDFGYIPAQVERVGSDALTAEEQSRVLGRDADGLYYPAVLRLERQDVDLRRRKAPLQAGMTLTADIKLRERRFISLLTSFLEDQRRNLERLR